MKSLFSKNINLIIIFSALSLLGIGMIMHMSITQIGSVGFSFDSIKKKLVMVVLSVLLFVVTMWIGTNFWKRYSWVLFALGVISLSLCFVPVVGESINGSARWLNLGIFGLNKVGITEKIQPSEFARLAIIIFLSMWFNKYQEKSKKLWFGFLIPGFFVFVIFSLIMLEPDISSAILLGGVTFFMFFVSGVRLRYLIGSMVVVLILCSVVIYKNENRRDRILAFVDIEKYKSRHGFQQYNSRKAIIEGGLYGEGLGNSVYKKRIYGADTDFVFSIIGNEMGIISSGLVLFCYILILFSGFYIQLKSKDVYKKMLVLGCVCSLILQSIIHIAVNIVIFPNTGIPLPFVSNGGSNLVVSFFTIGLIIRVYLESYFNINKNLVDVKILKTKFSPSGL